MHMTVKQQVKHLSKEGLYKTASGHTFNADVNDALNILEKSCVLRCTIP